MEAKINPNKTDRIIAQAMDEHIGEADSDLVCLSTGVVLRLKQAPPNLLLRVMTKVARPDPPMYMNTAMGRMMENTDDPDYVDRVKSWQMDYANSMMNALIGYGTELVSVPPGMEGPDPVIKKPKKPTDNVSTQPLEWIQDYQILGLPIIPNSPSWRYITWVIFKAAPTDADVNLITGKVKKLSGVKEADVRDAENFPDGDEAGRGNTS